MVTPAKILFKLPSRSRPEKFREALSSIIDNAASLRDINFLIAVDSDDPTRKAYSDVLRDLLENKTSHSWFVQSSSNSKIDAVNRDIGAYPFNWDILICMSDDMRFITPGFDNIIRADFAEHFPDFDGVLHYSDGYQKSNVMTMSIIGRKFFDRFGYIYHPDYKSVWCDVEATEVAHMLGKHRYMGDDNVLFHHIHPATQLGQSNGAVYDEQYKKSEDLRVWGEDLKTLLRRRATKYGLQDSEIVKEAYYTAEQARSWKAELRAAMVSAGLYEEAGKL